MRIRDRLNRQIGKAMAICAMIALFSPAFSQITKTKIENPDFGYIAIRLPESLHIDGDTIIAGSPESDPAYGNDGLVKIFRKVAQDEWEWEMGFGRQSNR